MTEIKGMFWEIGPDLFVSGSGSWFFIFLRFMEKII